MTGRARDILKQRHRNLGGAEWSDNEFLCTVYLCLLEESIYISYQLLLVARKNLTPSFSVDFFSSFNDQSDGTILARLSHVGGSEYSLQANSSFCLPQERPQLATIIRRDNDIHHKSRRVCVVGILT
ncbi:hypothetical protein Pelo_19067 [Pelomyxa schiedti]|nr:hypothetical protein Pelo_19067 [Pelomyxa schiedti]